MDIEDFWDHVNKNGPIPAHRPELGPCWIWTGGITQAGYGLLSINGKAIYAHRLAWEMEHGPIPKGMWVLHACDTPPCVRHLFLGTAKANTQDSIVKGRAKFRETLVGCWREGRFNWMRGQTNPRSKLTDAIVNEMRRLHRDEKWGYKRLHKHFGVSFGVTQRIINRKSWKHLPDPPVKSTKTGESSSTTTQ